MAHQVEFSIPKQQPLGKVDVDFVVTKDGDRVGMLRVSKGSIVWFPSNAWYGYKLDWSKFDVVMQEAGSRSEKR